MIAQRRNDSEHRSLYALYILHPVCARTSIFQFEFGICLVVESEITIIRPL
jgi:hypothetical protein